MHTLLVYGAGKGNCMADFTREKAIALGLSPKSIGKTRARKDFFPLVASLVNANSAVEITDHGEPVAVLLSYQNYVSLTAKVCANTDVKAAAPNLEGSLTINSDLEVASKEIAGMLEASMEKSAGSL